MAKICKVLVVEDHEGVRHLIGGALGERGFAFTLMSSADNIEEAIAGGEHEVVVIDVPLAGRDALEIARLAKERGAAVIFTTAREQIAEEIAAAGHSLMRKPFHLKQLLQLVRRVLREAEARCITKKASGA